MNHARRLPGSTLLALAALLVFAAAHAADGPLSKPDSGRLLVFSGDRPVGTEDFSYELHGDSLVVTAVAERSARGPDGKPRSFRKTMGLTARAADFSLLGYLSQQEFDGHTLRRQVMLEDTMLTATVEGDEHGSADKLARPPGRIYVVDGALYTLFDVIARNLHGRLFGPRPIGIVALGDSSTTVEATATPAGSDTVMWGNKRVITSRLTIDDGRSKFTLWLSPGGQMLRMENAENDLVVMREPPTAPPPPARPKRPRPRAPAR